MLVFSVVALLSGAALVTLSWAWREQPWLAKRKFAAVTAVGLLAVGLTGIGGYIWALSATDNSQFARALVWGESGYGDQERFPARMMSASPDPVIFRPAGDSLVEDFVRETMGTSLQEVLEPADTTAFIVLHGDQLLYEGYFNSSSRGSVQTSFSVAKSFISTLVGIAIEEGTIASLDDPVTAYIPELADRDQRFGEITLRHLITMASGLSFAEGSGPFDDPANTYHGTDLRSAAVTVPIIDGPPGRVFHYNDWNVILLGLVLERATETPVARFMETRLWQPMGAEAEGSWSLDSDDHGFEKMFVGVNGRAIDFAKLGWLYLNGGRNADLEVVPPDFVAEATSSSTSTDPAAEYQYLWWIDEKRASYFANGDHGQFIYVDPGANLVIVRHGRTIGDIDWIRFMGDLGDWLSAELNSR